MNEIENAKAFAKTLLHKPLTEAIGQLMLLYDGMDLISAKALLLLVILENKE